MVRTKFTLSKTDVKLLKELVFFYGSDESAGKKRGFRPNKDQLCNLKILDKLTLAFRTSDDRDLWLPSTYGISFVKGEEWFTEVDTDGELQNRKHIKEIQ